MNGGGRRIALLLVGVLGLVLGGLVGARALWLSLHPEPTVEASSTAVPPTKAPLIQQAPAARMPTESAATATPQPEPPAGPASPEVSLLPEAQPNPPLARPPLEVTSFRDLPMEPPPEEDEVAPEAPLEPESSEEAMDPQAAEDPPEEPPRLRDFFDP